MRETIKRLIKKTVHSIGLDICRFSKETNLMARKKWLLEQNQVNTIVDVGANVGQFALRMIKELGFTGKVLSFEPAGHAFLKLSSNAERFSSWSAFQYGLGRKCSESIINISNNSYSSSLLNMLPTHLQGAPESYYTDTEKIIIKSLDSLSYLFDFKKDKIFMKIDTQGYEDQVLLGAEEILQYINIIQLEMSLVPLYEGQMLFEQLHEYLKHKSYHLVAIEPGFTDIKTGEMLQVDGIYRRC